MSRSLITPLGKIVIDRTLRNQIVRQHVRLASTPIQVDKVLSTSRSTFGAASAWVCFRWNHCAHKSSLLVREIRRIFFPGKTFLVHMRTLLCKRIYANYLRNLRVLPIHIFGQPLRRHVSFIPSLLRLATCLIPVIYASLRQ